MSYAIYHAKRASHGPPQNYNAADIQFTTQEEFNKSNNSNNNNNYGMLSNNFHATTVDNRKKGLIKSDSLSKVQQQLQNNPSHGNFQRLDSSYLVKEQGNMTPLISSQISANLNEIPKTPDNQEQKTTNNDLTTLPQLLKPAERNGKLDVIRTILTKPVKRRSEEDMQDALLPLLRDIQFFKERDNIKEEDFTEIGQCLTYEIVKRGNNVFEWGSVGDKFYIILQGTVSVQVPSEIYKKKINDLVKEEIIKMLGQMGQERKQEDLASLLKGTPQESKHSYSEQGHGKAKFKLTKNPSTASFSSQTSQLSSDMMFQDKIAEFDQNIIPKVIKAYLATFSEHEDMQQYHLQSHFREVVQLVMSKSFGELALINNRPRAATIKCLTDCHFAVISKNVYERILKKIEVKNQNKLVDFFQHLPFFQGWSRTALAKLKYIFAQKEFICGQSVVREGDKCEKIILIRSGEFNVVKTKINISQGQDDVQEERQVRKMMDIQKDKSLGISRKNSLSNLKPSDNRPLATVIRTDISNKKGNGQKQLPFIVACIGPGELFGDYECYGSNTKPHYEFQLVCRSVKGEILELEKAEFIKKIQIISQAVQKVVEKSKEKRFLYYRQIINNKNVQQVRRLMPNLDLMPSSSQIETSKPVSSTLLGSPRGVGDQELSQPQTTLFTSRRNSNPDDQNQQAIKKLSKDPSLTIFQPDILLNTKPATNDMTEIKLSSSRQEKVKLISQSNRHEQLSLVKQQSLKTARKNNYSTKELSPGASRFPSPTPLRHQFVLKQQLLIQRMRNSSIGHITPAQFQNQSPSSYIPQAQHFSMARQQSMGNNSNSASHRTSQNWSQNAKKYIELKQARDLRLVQIVNKNVKLNQLSQQTSALGHKFLRQSIMTPQLY